MARRGGKPKGATIDDLPAALRAEIDEALLSAARESASSVFRRFGLSQRGLLLDTFIRYAGRLRRRKQADTMRHDLMSRRLLVSPDHLAEPELVAKLRRMVLVDAVARLNAGDAKLYETMSLLARIQDFDRIAIEKAAAERAAEKHEATMADVRRQLETEKAAADAKLDRMATERGIPGDVAERIKDLYGISV